MTLTEIIQYAASLAGAAGAGGATVGAVLRARSRTQQAAHDADAAQAQADAVDADTTGRVALAALSGAGAREAWLTQRCEGCERMLGAVVAERDALRMRCATLEAERATTREEIAHRDLAIEQHKALERRMAHQAAALAAENAELRKGARTSR